MISRNGTAKVVGVSEGTLRRYERAKLLPKWDKLNASPYLAVAHLVILARHAGWTNERIHAAFEAVSVRYWSWKR